MKLGFIGAGEMGGAIIKGLTTVGLYDKKNVRASVASAESAPRVQLALGIETATENQRIIEWADIIFIAVKPAVVPQVLGEIKACSKPGKIVVCMALGTTTEKMQAALGEVPVVRIMPNTPVAFGKGMTLLCNGKYTAREQFEWVRALFDRVGMTEEIPENLLNAATSVSGSGPAFIYTVIAGLARAAIQSGLDDRTAIKLAAQMTAGAAEMMLRSGKTPAELAREVATPGGCTAAGMASLQKDQAADVFTRAVNATIQKADEFSK